MTQDKQPAVQLYPKVQKVAVRLSSPVVLKEKDKASFTLWYKDRVREVMAKVQPDEQVWVFIERQA